jgi:class 3 adenylate cyclase
MTRGLATKMPCWMRSRNSLLGPGQCPNLTVFSRLCFLPTLSARPNMPCDWGIAHGAIFSIHTTLWCANNLPGFTVARLKRSVMRSSRPLKGPHARCAAPAAFVTLFRNLGIEIRAGLHTGEIELAGDDIGGIAVHIAARVIAAAGPREILVSSTVKDLAAGSGIRFNDRGTQALKGVPDECRLFALAP